MVGRLVNVKLKTIWKALCSFSGNGNLARPEYK